MLLSSSPNHLTSFKGKQRITFYVFDGETNFCDSPGEVVLPLFYYFRRKILQISPSCSNNHTRIRADMRILSSAIINMFKKIK